MFRGGSYTRMQHAQREERIKRNNAILEQLGVHTAAQAMAARHGKRPPQRHKRKVAAKVAIRKCPRLSRDTQAALEKEKLKALDSGDQEIVTAIMRAISFPCHL